MGRALPKIVMLIAIGAVVAGIYYVTQGGSRPARSDPGIVYISPGIGTPSR